MSGNIQQGLIGVVYGGQTGNGSNNTAYPIERDPNYSGKPPIPPNGEQPIYELMVPQLRAFKSYDVEPKQPNTPIEPGFSFDH